MMQEGFTHEVGDDPLPRRRVRISGPIYEDSGAPLLRVEYEDGNAECVSVAELRLFRSLDAGLAHRSLAQQRSRRVRGRLRSR